MFHEEGWQCFLVLDSTLTETLGPLGRPVTKSAVGWCRDVPAFSREDLSQRIIIWSGSEEERGHPFLRWYKKTSDFEEDLRTIKSWCEKSVAGELQLGDWPKQLMGTSKHLRDCVHDLQGCLNPIQADVQWLSTPVGGEQTVEQANGAREESSRACWQDYFGPTADSYLGENSTKHAGREIVGRVKEICALLPSDIHVLLIDLIASFEKSVESARKEMETYGEDLPAVLPSDFSGELKQQLTPILLAGNAILEKLQLIRKEKGRVWK
jgi:hypothetical protein